jgi:Holliday junction resolvase RusA-like endonuclease
MSAAAALVSSETVIRIVVPGPPKALERNRHRIVTPKGKASFVSNFLPAKSRNEQAVIRDMAEQVMAGRPPLEGPIDLRIAAYMPVAASWSKRKREDALAGLMRPTGKPDFDNVTKNVDAFKEVVWRDDAQVTDFSFAFRYSDRPRLVIEVRPIVLVPADA